MAKRDKQPTYEQAVAELETIIEKIESGEIGLEESLKHYEQGMKLLCQCKDILDAAEKKIATLAVDAAKAGEASTPTEDDSDVVAELDEACDDADSDIQENAGETAGENADDDGEDDLPF